MGVRLLGHRVCLRISSTFLIYEGSQHGRSSKLSQRTILLDKGTVIQWFLINRTWLYLEETQAIGWKMMFGCLISRKDPLTGLNTSFRIVVLLALESITLQLFVKKARPQGWWWSTEDADKLKKIIMDHKGSFQFLLSTIFGALSSIETELGIGPLPHALITICRLEDINIWFVLWAANLWSWEAEQATPNRLFLAYRSMILKLHNGREAHLLADIDMLLPCKAITSYLFMVVLNPNTFPSHWTRWCAWIFLFLILSGWVYQRTSQPRKWSNWWTPSLIPCIKEIKIKEWVKNSLVWVGWEKLGNRREMCQILEFDLHLRGANSRKGI